VPYRVFAGVTNWELLEVPLFKNLLKMPNKVNKVIPVYFSEKYCSLRVDLPVEEKGGTDILTFRRFIVIFKRC
jgi:hypothetical protein